MINPNEFPEYMEKLQIIKGKLPGRYTSIILKSMEGKSGYTIGKIRNAMSGLAPDWQVLNEAERIAQVHQQIKELRASIAA